MPSKVLLTAVEVGLFTLLAEKGPQTVAELTKALGFHQRGARDFFDALVALKFINRDNDDPATAKYSNTPATATFLDERKDEYIGGILKMANVRLYKFWDNLLEGLRTGKPQNETAHSSDMFGALLADKERLAIFMRAMTGVSLAANRAIAASSLIPWAKYKTFCDAGTAEGGLATAIALANPHLTGIAADLPQVREVCESFLKQKGVADRVRFEAVDFFKQPLPKVDVVTAGHILHDWDLEQKKQLCKVAYDALNDGGAFVVYEQLIDDKRREHVFGLLMSLNMLIETPGGFDFSARDAEPWLREAGFREIRSAMLNPVDGIIVAFK